MELYRLAEYSTERNYLCGCVLANRLSANADWKVLLIEAGGDETFLTDIPAMHNTLFGSQVDWNYTTVRQNRACLDNGGFCQYPRGFVMGGSSTINGMIFSKGNPKDYEEWEQMGNPGWGFKDVVKYYHRMEKMTDPFLANSPYHSNMGKQSVGFSRYKAAIYQDLFNAGLQYGLKAIDYNGQNQIGMSYAQLTIDGATRCSTSKAYLNPVRNRTNLYIFKNTFATKIIINRMTRTAVGVGCVSGADQFNVFALKEVVLSAGAINSPKLLMLSGIGPKEHLHQLAIPVLADLPVGKNLMDHNNVRMNFYVKSNFHECYRMYSHVTAWKYAKNKQGELSSNFMELVVFLNKFQNLYHPPDIQYHFAVGNFLYKEVENACLSVYVSNLSPKSRGSVMLRSTDPRDPPLIDPNYYGNVEDMKITAWGVLQAFRYLKAPSMAKYSLNVIANESCAFHQDPTSFLMCYLAYQTATIFHPSGTAKMGSVHDKSTVVNPQLAVHSINSLRVVDASIMPKITRGNTNAPTIMIAEKAADLIIDTYNYRYDPFQRNNFFHYFNII